MGVVPDELRAAIAEELSRLVDGDLPDLLTWVHRYGAEGATLVDQPETIWTHEQTYVLELDSGGWSVEVPLWTEDEAPSDLTAEVYVTPDRKARIHDVHVK